LIARDNVDAMQQALQDLLASQCFDAIHADQLWMAQYALKAETILKGNGANSKLVLDQHNAVYMIPKRLASSESSVIKRKLLEHEARIMKSYEIETCDRFDYVVWVTDEDRLALSQPLGKLVSDLIIPICVDPDAKKMVDRKDRTLRVTFLGGLHWPPNADGIVWFAREVWPKVLSQVPEARLTIIGKDPPRALLDSDEAIPNLDVTGYVDDPAPYLAETAVFIVPLHAAGGMRVKIIDAWSWGLPVVSTSIGAEGVQYRHDENLLIADDADTFADAVLRLLHNPELGESLAKAGRNTVETQYDWRKIYDAWEQVYPKVK
jgi:glycosyltransferase involved in cell wall biosynthesis